MNNLPPTLLQVETEAICQRYRIDPAEARAILEQHFAARPKLLKKIAERYPAEDVTRWGDYRKVMKAVKKQVYYHLRQYHQDAAKEADLKQQLATLVSAGTAQAEMEAVIVELLSTHVSTKERFPHYITFYDTLFDLIDPPRTILDLGCGLHPLSYPFQQTGTTTQRYIALDKDAEAIETLALYAPHVEPARLEPICVDLAAVRWRDYLEAPADLTVMLKLVPVVVRHHQDLLVHLAQVPSRWLLVTASAEAMTRKQSIRRREARVLREFIALTGREIVADFEAGSEFGYLLG